MSTVNASAAGAANQPSPSIWKNCPNTLLNDLGLGYFIYSQFHGITDTSTAEAENFEGFQCDADAAAVSAALPADQEGGRLDLETDGDDNDAVLLKQQIGPGFVIDSGVKVWFEARVALGAAADQGLLVGLMEEDGLDVDCVLDAATSVGTESGFYFGVWSGDTTAVNAEWNLDTGTGTAVLADVSNAAILTAQGPTAADYPVADTYAKFGITFDGKKTVKYYYDGYLVASLVLVAATHPDNVELGPIICLKTGTGAAVSMNIDFIRYAYQLRT